MFFRKIIYSKTKPLMNSNEYSIILWNGEKIAVGLGGTIC